MLKDDISDIVDSTINKVISNKGVRLNDYEEINSIYNWYIKKYIKQNKQIMYSEPELKQLYQNARTDFIKFMKEFYKK